MKIEEAKEHIGERVVYLNKYNGNEHGVIDQVGEHYVMVMYDGRAMAQATSPEDLVLEAEYKECEASNGRLVNYMIDKYIEDVVETIGALSNEREALQCKVLFDSLLVCKDLIRAMTEEFDIEKAPGEVYLFDKERSMFWKVRGYTRDIFSAKLFSLSEAKKMVNGDLNENTKIVYFS